jgi:hypothetical protein
MSEPKRTLFFRRPRRAHEAERRELMSSLAHTRTLIHQAYGCFNHSSDNELIESYVFEINALQARYNYLLRRVKELEASS